MENVRAKTKNRAPAKTFIALKSCTPTYSPRTHPLWPFRYSHSIRSATCLPTCLFTYSYLSIYRPSLFSLVGAHWLHSRHYWPLSRFSWAPLHHSPPPSSSHFSTLSYWQAHQAHESAYDVHPFIDAAISSIIPWYRNLWHHLSFVLSFR